jgi:hypothetical protein
MYSKDISWVQLDVNQDSMDKLNNFDLDRIYFYQPDKVKAPPQIHDSKYDIELLNNIMFSIGFKLVRVENLIGFERLLYAWSGEMFFPIKEAHGMGSFLINKINIHMRGMAHSGSNWLHMLISSDDNKPVEEVLSLQHELRDGSYVMHDMIKKETLIRIETFLTENDRDILIKHDIAFYSLFRTVDYALTVLRFV